MVPAPSHGQRGDRRRPAARASAPASGTPSPGSSERSAPCRAAIGSTLKPYVTSTRAEREDSQRRLPIPAAAAIRTVVTELAAARPVARPTRRRPRHELRGATDALRACRVRVRLLVPRAPRATSIPTCGAPPRCSAGRVAEGAYVVTSSNATTVEVRELLATDRVRTIHLGPPPVPTIPPDDRPASLPDTRRRAVHPGPRHARAAQEPARRSSPRSDASPTNTSDVRLVIAGAAGERPTERRPGDRRLDPAAAVADRDGSDPSTTSRRRGCSSTARTLAYPSLDEGFGFPILEAQQLGTPVVASTAGSIPEIAGAAALLSAPLDSEALAANLYWVVNERRHARQAGPPRARQPPPVRVVATADRLIDLYTELADRRSDRDDDRRSIAVVSGGVGAARFLARARSTRSTTRRRSPRSSTPATTA